MDDFAVIFFVFVSLIVLALYIFISIVFSKEISRGAKHKGYNETVFFWIAFVASMLTTPVFGALVTAIIIACLPTLKQ